VAQANTVTVFPWWPSLRRCARRPPNSSSGAPRPG